MDDELDQAALGRWLTAHVAGFAGPFAIAKFPGGQSNPTYRIDAVSGAYVLRRKPFGALLPSAHAVDREHCLIAALHPLGFPVATPLGLCADEGVIGAMFYVMTLIEGQTHCDGALPGMAPGQRRATYEAMIDTLARLHAIDPAAAGLGDYGRADGFFARQVARWSRQYRLAETTPLPDMDRLIDWLPRALPAQQGVAIVHGDYRIDNLIYAPGGSTVAGVLDWELSTLGDPLADLAYLLMNWVIPAEPDRAMLSGLDLDQLGIPTFDEAAARYCAASGRTALPPLDWYIAFGLFRMASICQGIRRRVLDGNASSARAEAAGARAGPLAELAWSFASRAAAGG